MIKIEKYVPMPSAKAGTIDDSFNELREIISEISVGDSFVIPEEFLIAHHTSGSQYVGRNVYNLFKRSGKKCAIRTIDKDKNIFRCWRIE